TRVGKGSSDAAVCWWCSERPSPSPTSPSPAGPSTPAGDRAPPRARPLRRDTAQRGGDPNDTLQAAMIDPRLLSATLALFVAACSSGGNRASGGTTNGSGGGTGTGTATGGTGAGTGAGTATGGAGAGGAAGTAFTYGLNLGYYNPQLNDTAESQLGLAAGRESPPLE